MTKDISKFFAKTRQSFDMAKKFAANFAIGNRIVPSRTPKKDTEFQLRIDAGALVDGKRHLCLQVNSQATATSLKNWVRRNGTHANLATAVFDTQADDLDAETDRVLNELESSAKKNI